MSIALNEYATKAFSEHPVAMWSLDDNVRYISLITNQQRLFDAGSWSASANATLEDYPDLSGIDPAPFPDSVFSAVSTVNPSSGDVVELVSSDIKTFGQLNQNMNSIFVNGFIFQNSIGTISYQVGYRYNNSSGDTIDVLHDFEATESKRWINFNFSSKIPEDYDALVPFKLIIKIILESPISPTQEYQYILNGLSVGQWSEISAYKDLGSQHVEIDSLTLEETLYGVAADQYGVLSNNGYYIVEDERLLSDNNALSMVFGSENSTNIYPSSRGNPSIVFPGQGVLSEYGRYQNTTLEFWIAIDPTTDQSRRIFGPVSNDYGIYVKSNVISMVIGNNIFSHPVYEWFRPMLVHIIFKESSISMVINGEEVGSVNVDRENLPLPTENDWLGFYSYEEFSAFKIDCVSVYPYIMPLQVCKKRFVWGQGVDTLQYIDSEFKGETTSIDFSNAGYDVVKSYPDNLRWDAGQFNNLSVSQTSLQMPNYRLPTYFIGGRDVDDWYNANKYINSIEGGETFLTFRPNYAERTNLMIKPSLETLKWQTYGTSTLEFSTDFAYTLAGQQSLKITLAGLDTSISAPHGFDDFVLDGAGTYWVSAYFYIDELNFDLDEKTITFSLEDGWGDAVIDESYPATLDNGYWVRASAKITVTDTAYLGRIVARISDMVDGSILYTDAWLLEKSDADSPGEYFDGDTSADSYWTGPSHSSTSKIPYWTSVGSDWTEDAYLVFDWSNQFDSPVNSFYGVFEAKELISETRPLIHLTNSLTGGRLEINISGTTISYYLNNQQLYTEEIVIGNKFVVGLNIESFASSFGQDAFSFFVSPSSIRAYVAGNGLAESNALTFEGKIYKVGFMNRTDYNSLLTKPLIDDIDNEFAFTTFFENELEGGYPESTFEAEVDALGPEVGAGSYFKTNGITENEAVLDFQYRYVMYGLIPLYRFNRIFWDIEIAATWEEYFPLTQFATYVKSANLQQFYDLDFLQINIGHEENKVLTRYGTQEIAWTYEEFKNKYNNPVDQTYETLDNEIITNYVDYNDLKTNAEVKDVYDFTNSSIFGYITFQNIQNGVALPISSFLNQVRLDDKNLVVADDVNTPVDTLLAYSTKFEFTSGTIVYPPTTLDFKNIAMVINLNFQHKGIFSTPINIRDMQISSKTMNETVPTEIGTKYGQQMIPYVKNGNDISYKEKNPFYTYSKSTPYLYTTNKSGIQVIDKSLGGKQYGIKIPINQQQSSDFDIAALQFWGKYEYLRFAKNGMAVMEFDYLDNTLELVVVKDYSDDRGIVYLRDKRTKNNFTEVDFYQNGTYVKNPIIKRHEWNFIGMTFPTPASMNQYEGSINLLSGMIYNNISYYKSGGLRLLTGIETRPWLRVLQNSSINPNRDLYWNEWYIVDPFTFGTWKQIYVLAETSQYVLTPEDIYKTYMGTNKSVVDNNGSISLYNKNNAYLMGIQWSRYSNKPA